MVHSGAIKAHPGAMKAHHRAVQVHSETEEVHSKLRRLILLEALILKSSVSIIFAASVMSYREKTSKLAK